MNGVTLINAFEVSAGREEEFLGMWRQVHEHQRHQPGFRSYRLHRSLLPNSTFRFINVVEWESAEHYRASMESPAFKALSASHGPSWADFRRTGALFEVIETGGPR